MQNKTHGKLFLSILFLMIGSITLHSMEYMDYFDKNIVKVYSHGFGEPGGVNGPTYPDAPGQINKAVFYTKSAVHAL